MVEVAWAAIGLLAVALFAMFGMFLHLGTNLANKIDALGDRLEGRIDALAARLDARIDSLAASLQAHIERHAG